MHHVASQRISAGEALKHAWFAEQPYPCPTELMPTFSKDEHELYY